MKIVTYVITEGMYETERIYVLEGPSTSSVLMALRQEFRERYGFPDPVALTSNEKEWDTFNAEHARAVESAASDLHAPDDRRPSSPSEAYLFVRWLKRDRGFTDHPFHTFHYDEEGA